MALIVLSRGLTATVDQEDYERLSAHKWYANTSHGEPKYAATNINGITVAMHRMILGVMPGVEVDHLNGDGFDNRRRNLRIATGTENRRNVGIIKSNKSGYKGVDWHSRFRRWRAAIRVNGKRIHLGYFDTAEQGAAAYNEAAIKHHGEFAWVNLIPGAVTP